MSMHDIQQLAAEYANIGFHEFHAAGNRQIWTPEMERLFGLPPGTFEGSFSDWVKRMHPEDRDRILAERSQCIARRDSEWRYEYRALMPDGGIRWIEGRSRLIFDDSGSLERIIGANIDVTEHREREQALTDESEQLMRINERFKRFSYTVAHDLKEPLRGITTMTELYLRRVDGTPDETSVQPLKMVLASAERMSRLIHDVLELAVGSGTESEANVSVDSGAVLRITLQDIGAAIRESRAKVTFSSLPVVRCEEGHLLRVFCNLISNAIKYRGSDPPEVHISSTLRGQEWVFCVKDNGIGIDPKFHKRIFTPFGRLHSSAQYEGTGLGLAISEQIIQRHKGRMWVESEAGKGCSFYFTLRPAMLAPHVQHPGEVPRKTNQSHPDSDTQSASARSRGVLRLVAKQTGIEANGDLKGRSQCRRLSRKPAEYRRSECRHSSAQR